MDGALLLDKPLGVSSNAALQKVKKIFEAKKAGHAGTLDPLATGLLLVLFGEATKFAAPLLDADKEYLATLKLGERTSTGDAEGRLLEKKAVEVSNGAVLSVLARFRGAIEQLPPMHSALKHEGVPLYRLARRGLSVERAARSIEIHVLELLEFADDRVQLRVECSKGTYIRTLVEQVGLRLGSCAHVRTLRRDFVEPFRNEAMISLEALLQMTAPVLIPADRAVAQLPALHLDAAQARSICFGQPARIEGAPLGRVRLYVESGRFMGLGASVEGGQVRALRLFALHLGARN